MAAKCDARGERSTAGAVPARLWRFALPERRVLGVGLDHALDIGAREIEVTPEAEDNWVALMLTATQRMTGGPDCTPGYYNNEGQDPGPAARLNVGFPAGAKAYFEYLDAWRKAGDFKGLAFR